MSTKTASSRTALLSVIVQSFMLLYTMAAVSAQVLICKTKYLDVEMLSCQVLDQFAKKDKCSLPILDRSRAPQNLSFRKNDFGMVRSPQLWK